MATYEGGCMCGKVRYRIAAPARFTSLCHCRSCQRATGAPVSAFVGVAAGGYRDIAGQRAIYRSSSGVRRGFCAACGTSLTYEGEAWPGEVHIHTATLDDPAAFPPTMHTMTQDSIPWFHGGGDLPRVKGFSSTRTG